MIQDLTVTYVFNKSNFLILLRMIEDGENEFTIEQFSNWCCNGDQVMRIY